ncbi:MAG: LptA/OstA family protein [Candidatus Pelagibacterales bacterium]
MSIFSGNVHAIENNLQIWSDKLIVTSSKDEENN